MVLVLRSFHLFLFDGCPFRWCGSRTTFYQALQVVCDILFFCWAGKPACLSGALRPVDVLPQCRTMVCWSALRNFHFAYGRSSVVFLPTRWSLYSVPAARARTITACLDGERLFYFWCRADVFATWCAVDFTGRRCLPQLLARLADYISSISTQPCGYEAAALCATLRSLIVSYATGKRSSCARTEWCHGLRQLAVCMLFSGAGATGIHGRRHGQRLLQLFVHILHIVLVT